MVLKATNKPTPVKDVFIMADIKTLTTKDKEKQKDEHLAAVYLAAALASFFRIKSFATV